MPVPELTFLGAARTVTGSKYLLTHGKATVLFDCGLFQGLKELRLRNWQDLPIPAASVDAVVLTVPSANKAAKQTVEQATSGLRAVQSQIRDATLPERWPKPMLDQYLGEILQRTTDPNARLTRGDAIDGRVFLLKKGARQRFVIRLT